MLKLVKQLDDPNGIVSKLVFENGEAIVETVAYKYSDRGVICFSCQSGCPIGCKFCGTGARFVRDLYPSEMRIQINKAKKIIGPVKKLQVMSMSMGEPMFCWHNVARVAEEVLMSGDYFFVSTVGMPYDHIIKQMIRLGAYYPKFGLQFSLHKTTDEARKKIISSSAIAPISQLLDWGREFTLKTGNKAYYNYICTKVSKEEISWLSYELSGMHLTCSVLCNTKGLIKASAKEAIRVANAVFEKSNEMVETSTFDPAGQDTIGGGCGQLLYVQEKLRNANKS